MNPGSAAPATPSPSFNRGARSLEDPSSIWVVVNKQRPLNPSSYVPGDLVAVPVPYTNAPQLRSEASDAVGKLFRAAKTEAGLALASNSAYRSFSYQQGIYNDDVRTSGQAVADGLTARPGYSEHQTGLAIDIGAESGACSLKACFADTPEGKWLAANAWRFGFLLRYPADKVPVAGFSFEPWHYRYVGTELAAELNRTGTATLEEFFGLAAAPTY